MFLCVSSLLGQEVSMEWAHVTGGSNRAQGKSLVTDIDGNVYLTGRFTDTLDFDPGAGILDLESKGSEDIFVQKLDSFGNFIWAKSFGGESTDRGHSISIDSSGDIYITGTFRDTVDFGTDSVVFNLIANSTSCFILKLNTNGDFVWAKSIVSSNYCVGPIVHVDQSDNVYVTGRFKGTIDLDPGTGMEEFTANGNFHDFFLLKLDDFGDYIWGNSTGGSWHDASSSLITDPSGNVFITGIYSNTVDFDPSANVHNITAVGYYDIFVQKLDVNGDFMWAKSMGSNEWDAGSSIVLDSIGNVYIAGVYRGLTDFDPGDSIYNLTPVGESDSYLVKLDSLGDFIWVKTIGSSDEDGVNSLAIDKFGGLYFMGFYKDQMDFNPGVDTFNLISSGHYDTYIEKLDSNGDFIWVKSIGGVSEDFGNSMTIDDEGNIYSTGYFEDSVDFDIGDSTFNLLAGDGYNVFVQKWSNCLLDKSINVDDYELTANHTGDSYQWLDCNNEYSIIPGETGQSFDVIVNGTYAVEIIDNECSTISECVTISHIGIEENYLSGEFTIFPNPSTGIFNLETNSDLKNSLINVYDVNGISILSKWSDKKVESIDLSNYPSSIYFINIISGSSSVSKIIFKDK